MEGDWNVAVLGLLKSCRTIGSFEGESVSKVSKFEAGGIGEIGTDVLRLESRAGEGERARLDDGDVGDEGLDEDGDVRGNRNENGLKGSLD